MSALANKEFIRRMNKLFSGQPKTEALLSEYIADQTMIDHSLASEASFPLYRIDIIEILAEGDLVSIRGDWSGTHLGEFMGVPGTGKSFSTPIFVTYRIRDGKVVDHWMLIDSADLLRQLGITQMQKQGG